MPMRLPRSQDLTEVGGIEDPKRASGAALASVQKQPIEFRAGRRRCAGASRPLHAVAWSLVRTASTQRDCSGRSRPHCPLRQSALRRRSGSRRK